MTTLPPKIVRGLSMLIKTGAQHTRMTNKSIIKMVDSARTHKPPIIYMVPVELILEIMEHMRPQEIFKFVLADKRLFHIFAEKRDQILLKVIRQCPELENLLYLFKASEKDFLPNRMLHPMTVTFSLGPEGAQENKVFLMHRIVEWQDGKIVCPEKIKLNGNNLLEIAQLAKVIDWWVDVYPRLRWRDHPEDRRCLKSDEESRLRMAIARLWLYSHYFHGNYWRSSHHPKLFDRDTRLHHVRLLTTQEIHELDDLWSIMYETISKDLCSSPGTVYRRAGGSTVELIPWGKNGDRHSKIVRTYLKLDPELLKYFLEHCYRYHKEYLMNAITNSTKDLLHDCETLTMSIATVMEERAMLDPSRPETFPPMGILNEDRASAEDCEVWNDDASPTGFPPITDEQLAELPYELTQRIPRGDDGSDRGGAC